ncbi:MAG: hypothetical protein AB2A00_07575 [Myxococcota bacterium]
MSSFKIMPRNTIPISDLKNPAMEELAKQYDVGSKGYLTTEEAFRLYAAKNNDVQPTNIQDVLTFLGGAQHKMTVRHMDAWEVLGSPWLASNWKGDFSVKEFGAGNVRVGRDIRPDYTSRTPGAQIDQFVFLIDMNLVDQRKLTQDLANATVVVGPKGWKPEAGSSVAEAVEIPLALATQEGYQSYSRSGGGSWVPEKKFLAAAVDTEDLRALAGNEGELEFFVRLQTNEGRTLYINKDGQPMNNFHVSGSDLKSSGNP